MTATWLQLVLRVDRSKYADAFMRIQTFMNRNGLHAVSEKPSINKVVEVLSLWQIRDKNTGITGVAIPGAATLIDNLQQMHPDALVEQYGFTGEKLAGSIFFNRETGEFLGDTIVERRPKSQAMLDLEDKMIDPVSLPRAKAGSSRKSA